jgi:hypothetical protein
MAEKERDKQWQTPLAQGALRPRQRQTNTFPTAPLVQDEVETATSTSDSGRRSVQAVEAEIVETEEPELTAVPEPEIIEATPVETAVFETATEIIAELIDEESVQDAKPTKTNTETATMIVATEVQATVRPCLAEFVAYETAVVAAVAILGTTLYGWSGSSNGLETAVRIGLIISSILAVGLIAATFTVFARCKQRNRVQDSA